MKSCQFLKQTQVLFNCIAMRVYAGFPGGTSGKEPDCRCRRRKRLGFDPWVGKIPWRRARQPTPVFLPGESHGQEPGGLQSKGLQSRTGLSKSNKMLLVKFWFFANVFNMPLNTFGNKPLFVCFSSLCLVAWACLTLLWPYGLAH